MGGMSYIGPTATSATDSEFDAKGDIVVGTGSDAGDRLAIGSNDTVLTADSAETTGMKWSSSVKGTHVATGTAPTCTGATIGTGSKNNAGFVTATTTGATTCVVTFSITAPTGWTILAQINSSADKITQTASSTTTATLSGVTESGDVISYIAFPY